MINFSSFYTKKWAITRSALGSIPRIPEGRAPGQIMQHCLRLIVLVMSQSDFVPLPLPQHLFIGLSAQNPAGLFLTPPVFFYSFRHRTMKNLAVHISVGTVFRHQSLISKSLIPSDTMIDMNRAHLITAALPKLQQQKKRAIESPPPEMPATIRSPASNI